MNFIKFTREILEKQHLSILREIGRQIGVKAPAAIKTKNQLIQSILDIQSGVVEPNPKNNRGAHVKMNPSLSQFIKDESTEYPAYEFAQTPNVYLSDSSIPVQGVLEIHKDGYGFLRVNNYENSKQDAHVSSAIIKKFNLRRGDFVNGYAIPKNENAPDVQDVIEINGTSIDRFKVRKDFDDLTPCYPEEQIKLERPNADISMRCIDLFAPLGMGQRGLIVAPPKTGKTTLLKNIARSIEKNYPAVKLIVLLIDERPEEVTDFSRAICSEVVYSTFDEGAEHHVRVAELVLQRAKRLVEMGKDVVILLDSITRLTRAYNYLVEPSGKTLSGGIDPMALQAPKRFFGSARNIEDGGSLTILSTALVDTESRMDDVIFEEFKGTGNMEIKLSRELSEKRIFPAIDLDKSGTRKDDLLLTSEELDGVIKIRRLLSEKKCATDALIEMLKKTKDNQDLLSRLDAWIKIYQK